MIKIGILSLAHMHAYGYAACLKAMPGVELTAIWDDDRRRGKAAAAQFGATWVKNLDHFLEHPLDGVIICAENVRHRALVEAAAAAGKWVLCEKPLATTVADAKAMIRACKQAGVGLATAFPCRFAPTLLDARRRIVEGEIGTVYAVSCTNNGKFPGGWFADPALSGGGATMDHTVHVADLLRWMLGKEFVRVFCANGNLIREGLGTDDVGSVQMEMEDGVIVSHVASWNRAACFPTWGDVTMEFMGSEGVLNVNAFSQKVDVYDDVAMRVEWAGWGDNADEGLVADFVEAIRDERPPAVTGEDGLRAVEVTVAAYASAASGKFVRV